jgi:heptosyltransferase-2
MKLLVRLPNWVGDVCMALPALQALQACGFEPTLAGRGWAADLLAGHAWPVLRLPAGLRASVGVLRATGIRHGLLLTNSLSSAAACRLAGVSALGQRNEGRSPLLGRAIGRATGLHEVEVFWRLAREATDWLAPGRPDAAGAPVAVPLSGPPPPRLGLRLSDAHEAAARAALAAACGGDPARIAGYVVIAPLAAGTAGGASKVWPEFGALARQLARQGVPMVCCPGPGEEVAAGAAVPEALQLPGLGLGAYAAVCRGARATVANDSGPMHLAAAVDAPVVGVFGPGSQPARTHPWGRVARWLGGPDGWPAVRQVLDGIERLGD